MVRILFYLGIVYTMVLVPYFAINANLESMWAILISGGLIMIFTNLQKLRKFKITGSSIEAEIRETIDEANITIENLRELSVALADPIIAIIAVEGVIMEQLTLSTKLEIVDEISSTLSKLKVEETKITEARKFFDAIQIRNHFRCVKGQVIDLEGVDQKVKDKINELSATDKIYEAFKTKEGEILALFSEEILTHYPNLHDSLKDLDYYIKNKSLRRPDLWK